jgi:hypothetical protein
MFLTAKKCKERAQALINNSGAILARSPYAEVDIATLGEFLKGVIITNIEVWVYY